MTLEQLRVEVLNANLRLVRDGLVVETFGNASGIDRERGLVRNQTVRGRYPDSRPPIL